MASIARCKSTAQLRRFGIRSMPCGSFGHLVPGRVSLDYLDSSAVDAWLVSCQIHRVRPEDGPRELVATTVAQRLRPVTDWAELAVMTGMRSSSSCWSDRRRTSKMVPTPAGHVRLGLRRQRSGHFCISSWLSLVARMPWNARIGCGEEWLAFVTAMGPEQMVSSWGIGTALSTKRSTC